jgi:hypothetical protein
MPPNVTSVTIDSRRVRIAGRGVPGAKLALSIAVAGKNLVARQLREDVGTVGPAGDFTISTRYLDNGTYDMQLTQEDGSGVSDPSNVGPVTIVEDFNTVSTSAAPVKSETFSTTLATTKSQTMTVSTLTTETQTVGHIFFRNLTGRSQADRIVMVSAGYHDGQPNTHLHHYIADVIFFGYLKYFHIRTGLLLFADSQLNMKT